jgi:hypothetical protein
MSIPTESKERLLGQMALGAQPRTACDCLGIAYADLLDELDADAAFGAAYFYITSVGKKFDELLGRREQPDP